MHLFGGEVFLQCETLVRVIKCFNLQLKINIYLNIPAIKLFKEPIEIQRVFISRG